MFGGSHDPARRARENRDLQDRVDALERERDDRLAIEERDRERRRCERDEKRKADRHEASSWPEAFRKQIVLLWQELAMAQKMLASANAEIEDEEFRETDRDFWDKDVADLKQSIAAVERAAALYAVESANLEDQLRALRAGVCDRVASTIEEEFGKAAADTAECLRSGEPARLLNW